jgi:NADH-quinone oxidoreductase subunit H
MFLLKNIQALKLFQVSWLLVFSLVFFSFIYLHQSFFLNVPNLFLDILLSLIEIIGLLIAVAFYTLAERKVMAAVQRRKGPNVVGIWGFLQPLADGLKLILKEIIYPSLSNYRLFIFAPLFTFLMSLIGWAVIPWSFSSVLADIKLSALFIFAVSSFGVYGIILAGWASNSKYAFLGCMRSTAQMISYEIVLGFILLIVALFAGSLNLKDIVLAQTSIWFFIPLAPLVIIFFIAMLAETNRIPFDLPEAEAELVAGYNTEYSSIIFAMFFLAEYSNMLLMASLLSIFFFGGWLSPFLFIDNFFNFTLIFSTFWLPIKISIIAVIYILIRAAYPRVRYDQLMRLCWKEFLPLCLGLLFFYIGLFYSFHGFALVL